MTELSVSTATIDSNNNNIYIDKYLVFEIENTLYCTPAQTVKEIIQHQLTTDLPESPDFVTGIINLRDEIIPVIDLKSRLGKGLTEITDTTCIVIIEKKDDAENITPTGITVENVVGVLNINKSTIVGTGLTSKEMGQDYIIGVSRHEQGEILMINFDSLLHFNDFNIPTSLQFKPQA